MPELTCTPWLKGLAPTKPTLYQGKTVRDVLTSASPEYPRLKSYILDDQGRLRKHVNIFVSGQLKNRDIALDCVLNDTDQVFVMQALSGG